MTNRPTDNSPFIIAGSLPAAYVHYVASSIDTELLNAIENEANVIVYGPRQTGKSSLKIRTMQALQQKQYLCAGIDFTMLKNDAISFEKAVFSFWFWVAKVFGLVKTMDEFKLKTVDKTAVLEVITGLQINFQNTRIVLFIDEADAALQYINCGGGTFFDEILNSVSALNANLQFVFLGTALPTDFFSEELQTKQPEELRKKFFTVDESYELCKLLNFEPVEKINLLVYSSTGGQPQLTQRICDAIFQHTISAENVEIQYNALIENLFFTESGLAVDTNLRAVEHTFNHYRNYAPAMAYLIEQIITGNAVMFEASNYEHQALLLTGMFKVLEERLVFSNEIYKRYFSENIEMFFDL